MPQKSSERKSKDIKSAELDANLLATFTLPDSLPCSEVAFPVLIKRRNKANWNSIIEESNRKFEEIEEYGNAKKETIPKSPFLKTECDYIEKEVFTYLIPALVDTLNKARIWNAFESPRCFFNGIDHIVQQLWNSNPRYVYRKEMNLHLFNMPWVRKALLERPRQLYPKSWLWTEDYAATLIQKTVRQYFVQRDEEVQELREFWKKLQVEKNMPEMEVNPFLSKKFASEHHVHHPHKN